MRTTIKNIGIVIVGTFLGQLLNFFSEILIAANFGTSASLDAYLLAFTIVTVIAAEPVGWISAVFIPVYTGTKEKKGEKEAYSFLGVTLGTIVLFSIVVIVIGIVIAPFVINLCSGNFSPTTKNISTSLFRTMAILIMFMPVAALFSNALNAHRHFLIPALGKAITYIVIIACILTFVKSMNIFSLAIGMLVGTAIFLLLQFFYLNRTVPFKISFSVTNPALKEMLVLISPLVLASSMNQVNILVERVIAAGFAEGTIASLNYAIKLTIFPVTFFMTSIMTVLFPKFSELNSSEPEKLYETTSKVLKLAFLVLVPICIFLIVFAHPIVRIVFERGAFTASSTKAVASALRLYAPGLIGLGGIMVLSRVYHAMKNTKTLTKIGITMMISNIILVIILTQRLGSIGIPVSFSIVSSAHCILLFLKIKK